MRFVHVDSYCDVSVFSLFSDFLDKHLWKYVLNVHFRAHLHGFMIDSDFQTKIFVLF